MKIVTLMENIATRPDLTAEHGLSLYIETGNNRILFDAGQSGAFAENAEKLGVSLETVDFAVLSHGHYDHGGGLTRFLEKNTKATVYIRQDAFRRFLNSAGKYIGLDTALQSSDRVCLTGDVLTLAPGITLLSCNEKQPQYPIDSDGMNIREGDSLLPDTFRHEQYLLIEDGGKRVLISGCSHKGILNIAQWFRPDVLIGGFHFMKQDPQGELVMGAAEKLLEYPTAYYTGHCTGLQQFRSMKKIMGSRLEYLSAGTVLEL